MNEPVTAFKLSLLTMAALAVPAAADTAAEAERIILGARESVLLVALAGSFIGACILPRSDIARLLPDPGVSWPRAVWQVLVRGAGFAFGVLAYAQVAAWAVDLLPAIWDRLAGAPALPLAGLAGVGARPLLPRYLQFLGNRGARPRDGGAQ
jgi:hypothetical protein